MRGRAICAVAALSACQPATQEGAQADRPFDPQYGAVETRLLEGDLVNFFVEMRGARDNADVAAYAECVAAQYAVIRGFGFTRLVRTNVTKEAGIWRGDAVYTVSPTLPRGTRAIDAEIKLADCVEQGIPTV